MYGDPAEFVKFMNEGRREMQRDLDEVEVLLDMWADWMRRPEPIANGFPDTAAGGFIASWRKDSEDFEAEFEMQTIEKVNASFDSLGPVYKEAIRRHYSLGHQVWRFGKEATFDDAKCVIRHYFLKRGLL